MLKYKTLYLFAIILFLVSACTNKEITFENTEALVTDAKSHIKTISVSDFNTVLSEKGKYMLIDCREAEEYSESHIKGAINIPRGKIEFSDKLTGKNINIYVYSLNSDRAALVSMALKRLKFSNVLVIDGGITEWTEAYPDAIEKSSDEEDEEE